MGIILCEALNMFNPEEVMPEIRLTLGNRYSPRQHNHDAADNRQQTVEYEIFSALLRENPRQYAEHRNGKRQEALGHHAHAAG